MSKSKLTICPEIFLFLGIQLILSSCFSVESQYINPTEHPDLVDQSWLKAESCAASCWQGLVIGKSLQKDAIAVARNLPFLGSERVETTDVTWTSFLCKVPNDKVCMSMGFDRGILSNLSLYPNYRITFEEAIEKIGSPDSFYYSRKEAEMKGCSISFLWEKRQMILVYGDKPISIGNDLCDLIYQNNGKIPKGLLVQQIEYLSLSQMKMIIKTIVQVLFCKFGQVLTRGRITSSV